MEPQMQTETKTKTKRATAVQDKVQVALELKTRVEQALEVAVRYGMVGEQIKLLETKRKKDRPIIEALVRKEGVIDPVGHKHIESEEVEVTLQRRVSTKFNAMVAEQILRKKNLYDQCTVEVTTITLDEDKIQEAYEGGLLTPKDIQEMFVDSISEALIVKVNPASYPEFDTMQRMRKEMESEV